MLSFLEFIRIGSEQRYSQSNWAAALFIRWFGPLGTHARIRNARILNTLSTVNFNGKRILDIGCGHGYLLFWLARKYPQANLTGIDVDLRQVEACRRAANCEKITNVRFLQGTYSDLQENSNYDVIITIDVLEHVVDDVEMLKKIKSLLAPEGMVVIHVPLRHQVQRRILPHFSRHTVYGHVRDEYLPEELCKKVNAAGLCVKSISYGFGFWGELSFELNNLFWNQRWLRTVIALITLPAALVAGYIDSRSHLAFGNSIVLVATH
jgi:2-polyprenyl-3-methyl-5-hydroxy-6-metoxy-1,4-benzoquinol methylase